MGKVFGCFPAPSRTLEEKVSEQLLSSVFLRLLPGVRTGFCWKCGVVLRGGQGGLGAIHSKKPGVAGT